MVQCTAILQFLEPETERKGNGFVVERKSGGYYVTLDSGDWFIFNRHCDTVSEFVCLLKEKTDTIEYGNGNKFINHVHNVAAATVFLWRCTKCRVGFATHPKKILE